MGFVVLLTLLIIIPLVLFIAYLVLSSCLGDSFRAYMNPRRGAYDSNYLRTMTSGGSGLSEQIELQNMLEDRTHYDYAEE